MTPTDSTDRATGATRDDQTPSADWSNATLITRTDVTDDLSVFRVRDDDDRFAFRAGQFAVLGLPDRWPRCEGADPVDAVPGGSDRLIKRAYSLASSSRNGEYVEFYISLVRSGALTPRLWTLRSGDRIWLGPKARGNFTMDDVPADKHVVFVGTGTGLAPYMSMIREHHRCNGDLRFVVVHGARYTSDLGYREELEALDRACSNLAYLPTVSRREGNSDWTGHIGRVQTVFADGALETALEGSVSPAVTHVFLSGNPEMVEHLQEMLLQQSYTIHRPAAPGSLHVERYW